MYREDYLGLKIGALLHDIGKVVHNTDNAVGENHSEQGFQFLNSISNFKNIALFAKYHHHEVMDGLISEDLDTKTNNLIRMVCEADTLSIGEKGEYGAGSIAKNPLTTVFSTISNVNENAEPTKQMIYPIGKKLDMSTFVFPGYVVNPHNEAAQNQTHGDWYEFLRKSFPTGENGVNEDLLLMCLEENTSFIPARITEDSDISLFDHLKTTCAIASCMYMYHERELELPLHEKIVNSTDMKYLLVGGDVSGIQKFIYHISSKGALKLLRGRSFYLEMFCEDIVNKILKELDLSRANVLYSGGGRFFILAPNTEVTKEKLQNIRNELDERLLDTVLGSTLYLTISWVAFTGNEFGKFADVWHEISRKISFEKSRKYAAVLKTSPERVLIPNSNGSYCDACKRIVPDDELKLIEDDNEARFCQSCYQQYNVGKKLAEFGKLFYIVQSKSISDPDISLLFSDIKLVKRDELHKIHKLELLYSINSWDQGQIKELIESGDLDADVKVTALPVAVYSAEKGGEILDLDNLANFACGSKKIGALRMDVDNLGAIFGSGLPEKKRNISRISSLSRFMNYFFKGYLNLLGEFKESNILGICNNHYPANPRLMQQIKQKRNFNIIYAGGDDLFVIGSWDDVFELAFDIEAVFRKYVGDNDNITISAGFSIFDSKHPLYQIATICGKNENCAKDEGKNRIYLFDRNIDKQKLDKLTGVTESIIWDRARELFHDFEPFFDEIRNETGESLSKAGIRVLLAAREEYCNDPDKIHWLIGLHYYISRNKQLKKLIDENAKLRMYFDTVRVHELSPIYDIDLPLIYLDLISRR